MFGFKKRQEKAQLVLTLTETTRELFKKMHFPEIPEGVTHVAFLENGEAVFLNEFKSASGAWVMPKMAFFSYFESDEGFPILMED